MQNKFLPIGTVVLLKNATKKIMITGYCMKTAEYPDKIFDYNGCPFPEGTLKSDVTSVFDHDQIDKVYHVGHVNEESKTFFEKLNKKLKEYSEKEK